jgi:hypothetical protein
LLWDWSKFIVFAVFEVPNIIVYWNEIEHPLVLPLKNIQPLAVDETSIGGCS